MLQIGSQCTLNERVVVVGGGGVAHMPNNLCFELDNNKGKGTSMQCKYQDRRQLCT